MLETLSGIVTLVSAVQEENVELSMVVTLSGIAYAPVFPPGY